MEREFSNKTVIVLERNAFNSNLPEYRGESLNIEFRKPPVNTSQVASSLIRESLRQV